MTSQQKQAAKFLESRYDLSKFKGQRIDISEFPEYSNTHVGLNVFIEVGSLGKIKSMKQIPPAELREMEEQEAKKREEKEAKEMVAKLEKEDMETVIKNRIKLGREEKELQESPEMQSEEFRKKKQVLQDRYADLITAGESRSKKYNPNESIEKQPEYFRKFNAVVNAERDIIKLTKKLSRLRGDTAYVDTLKTVRSILGNDTNFGVRKQAMEDARLSIGKMGERFESLRNASEPGTIAPVIEQPSTPFQPKKSTQDADRKKTVSDEELKRILGS